MTFTPKSHAAWDGTPPLRSGLAVERESVGTLGAAITLPSGKYFTCARHVAGEPAAAAEAMSVYRTTDEWLEAPTLERLDQQAEPGAAPLLRKLDLCFLRCTSSAVNVTPDGAPAQRSFGVVLPGDVVRVRGARHDVWIDTTYQADFGPEHEQFFVGLPYDTRHLGIIDLVPLGPEPEQNGNSGAILWLNDPGGYAVVGHFVAASRDAPLGLIVQYRSAIQALALSNPQVIS